MNPYFLWLGQAQRKKSGPPLGLAPAIPET
jgi:hypothetical protein